jgi:diacylglycerol kinase (ATP)
VEIAVVVNPTSGKGRGALVQADVVRHLCAGGANIRELVGRDAEGAVALCREAVADGVDALVAVGGDGMVHLALQAVAGTPTPLGIVPAGTGNDLATELGIPVRDIAAATAIVLRGGIRRIDAVRTDAGRWFGCVLGAGFDSVVNERANRMRWPRGNARYNLAILAELPRFAALPFTITLDGEEWRTDAMLVAVGNATSYGGGYRITPDARLDDGLLDVLVLGPVGKLDFVRTLPKARTGRHVRHPAVTVRRARTVTLASPGVVAYADGERIGPLPLAMECVPEAVTVLA